MKNQTTPKNRRALKHEMAAAFNEEIKTLTPDIQDIFLDDLITALENRLITLNRAQQKTEFLITIMENAECEPIKTWDMRRHPESNYTTTAKANSHNVQSQHQLLNTQRIHRISIETGTHRKKNSQEKQDSLRHYPTRSDNAQILQRNPARTTHPQRRIADKHALSFRANSCTLSFNSHIFSTCSQIWRLINKI